MSTAGISKMTADELAEKYFPSERPSANNYIVGGPEAGTKVVGFRTRDVAMRNVRASGSHYFEADTLKFFGGRITGQWFGHRFGVQSDISNFDGPRLYRVWWVQDVPETFPIAAYVLQIGRSRFIDSLEEATAVARRAGQLWPAPDAQRIDPVRGI